MAAEIYEEAKSLLSRTETIAGLARFGSVTPATAQSAIDYAIPVILGTLQRRAEDSAGIVDLLNEIRSMRWVGLESDYWSADSLQLSSGRPHLEMLFHGAGIRAGHVGAAAKLGDRARVADVLAGHVLGVTAWVVLALLSRRFGPALDRQTLLRVANGERQVLSVQGWDPWIRAVEWESNAIVTRHGMPKIDREAAIITPESAGLNKRTDETQVPQNISASDNPTTRYPPPVRRRDRQDSQDFVAPVSPTSPVGPASPVSPARPGASQPAPSRARLYGTFDQSGGYSSSRRSSDGFPPLGGGGVSSGDGRPATTRHRPMSQAQPIGRHPRPRPSVAPTQPRWWPVGFAFLALLVTAAGAYFVLRDGSDEVSPETTAAEDVGVVTDTDQPDAGTELVLDAGEVVAGKIAMVIPMVDIFQGTAASGEIKLDIDSSTGEICFSTSTSGIDSPYQGYIRAGELGVEGETLVDFGNISDAQVGCVQNQPVDIQAVLANPAGYYAEMRDPNLEGGLAIRGQLADAVNVVDPENVLAGLGSAIDPAVNVAPGPGFDPNGNGAFVQVEDGRLILQGDVPTEAAAQQVRDQLAGVDLGATQVEDRLVVAEGAPLPSGRLVVADAIFFAPGSSTLAAEDTTVIQLLANIINGWSGQRLTVVGHTDDVGTEEDNFELSRRRAGEVAEALVNLGVSDEMLTIEGQGESDPIAEGTSPEARNQNGRIEFKLDFATN